MNRLKFVGTSQAPATRPIPVRTTSAGVEDSDAHYDDLAALVAELGDADPTFAELLSDAGRELSPLALTRDGRVTLTSLRMQAGLTQTQLADKVGQRQSNISLYESGLRTDMKRETMRAFCAALGCDMNTLDQALESSAETQAQRADAQEAARIDGAGKMKDCA